VAPAPSSSPPIDIIDWLVQAARPYVYTDRRAAPPWRHALRTSLQLIAGDEERAAPRPARRADHAAGLPRTALGRARSPHRHAWAGHWPRSGHPPSSR
jgi:hypothetical protein